MQVFDILGRCVVHYTETKVACQVAFAYSHFPIGLWLFFVNPLQAYVAVLLTFHNIGVQCVVLTVDIAPCELHYSVFFYHSVGQPTLQSVVCAQQLPQQIGFTCSQRIF